jgi:hypothetical protein
MINIPYANGPSRKVMSKLSSAIPNMITYTYSLNYSGGGAGDHNFKASPGKISEATS